MEPGLKIELEGGYIRRGRMAVLDHQFPPATAPTIWLDERLYLDSLPALAVAGQNVVNVEPGADLPALTDSLDGILGQGRGIGQALSAQLNQPLVSDHGVRGSFLNCLAALCVRPFAKGKSHLFQDRRQQRQEV